MPKGRIRSRILCRWPLGVAVTALLLWVPCGAAARTPPVTAAAPEAGAAEPGTSEPGTSETGTSETGTPDPASAPAALPAVDDAPWERGPFSASAAALIAAGNRAEMPEGAPALMLFQNAVYRFERDGRLVFRRHWVYRVDDPVAFAEWSKTQVRWSPWYEDKPSIRARVILPDGRERWLEGSSLSESRAAEGREGHYGDRRIVEAALPDLLPGSIVEEEVALRDLVPGFAAGTTHRHYTAFFIPGLGGRLLLDAPTNLALRYGVRKMNGVEPETEVADGRVRVRFEFGALPAVGPSDEGAPGHRPRFPHVAFSTGRNWQRVATRLSRQVDDSVKRASLNALAGALPPATATPAERLDRVLALLRERVVHDGLDLDATPGLPVDPDAVIERGRGDGLDLAVTLVAMLRRVGVPAHIALVNASFGLDVEPRLPGLGLFNHAMVRAEVKGGLWLDPSAPFARPGDLPLSAQGRFVLLATTATEKLELLPASEPEDNLAVEQREVHFADFGPGRLIERCRYFGSAGRTQRRITGSLGSDNRRRGYQAYVHAFHHAAGLGVLNEGDPNALDGPFELELEALDSNRIRTELEKAVLEVPIRELARRLPPIVLEAETNAREEEFVFPEPFVSEWTYVVHPPPGFRLVALPPDRQLRFGPASFSQHFERNGNLVRGWLRFDVGQRLITAHQFSDLVDGIRDFLGEPPVELHFELAAAAGLDESQLHQALDELRRAAEREPGRSGHRVRLSQMLLRTGMVAEARRQARQAVALAPRWGLAHWAVAMTLQYDGLARRFAPGAELDTSRRALSEAVRLSPNEPRIRADLARLAERDTLGRWHGPDVDLELAIDGYRQWRNDFDGDNVNVDLLTALAADGRWSEIAEEAPAMSTSPERDAFLVAARAVLDSPVRASEGIAATTPTNPDAGEAKAGAEPLPQQTPTETTATRATAAEIAAGAVGILIRAREYTTAAALLRALDRDGDPRLPALEQARRFEQLELHPDDPATPVRQLLIALRHDTVRRSEIEPWLGSARFEALADEIVPESLLTPYRQRFRGLLPRAFADTDLPPAVVADLGLANFEPKVNGAPFLGYRLGHETTGRFFVTLDAAGGLRVVGTDSELDLIGAEILARLEAGDLPGSGQWLDWAKELELPKASAAFHQIWNPGPKDGTDRRRARIAAVVLATGAGASAGGGGETAIERARALRRELSEAPDGEAEDRQLLVNALDMALLRALGAQGRHGEVETLAGELNDAGGGSELVLEALLHARKERRDWRGMVETAEVAIEASGPSAITSRALLDVALASGDIDAARDHLEQIRALGQPTLEDVGREMLIRMLELPPSPAPDAEPEVLAAARSEIAALLDPGYEAGAALPGAANSPEWLRVEAARALELGRLRDALRALRRAVPTGEGPRLADLYLMGRLAEAAGFRNTARERYSELLGNRDAPARAPLYRLLAERRIGGLIGTDR